MNKLSIFSLIALLMAFGACQKQQTEADRNAEVERQVNERLAAERQAAEQQRLAQRQDELDSKLNTLTQEQSAVPEATVAAERASERETITDQGAGASYSMFYTKLEPHGSWLETSDYGYVWQPRFAAESRTWRPYTNGHWVYTDAGWTWISEEPFGWATYHYGRWTRLRGIGWVWVPGDEWAPAWVSWRTSNDYVGWAPLPPEAQFERRTGIRNWADNYYDIGPEQYCFVPTREIGSERIERVVVAPEQNVTIVNQTTNVTNITYNNTVVVNQGPSYDELRTRSQRPIQRLRLERRTEVNLATENPRPIVRGEVVELPAPVVTRARPIDRAPVVKQKITTTVVEHGWENIGNAQAAQQARAKIKSEATPPPDAPPKVAPKPAAATTQPRRAAAPSPVAAATANTLSARSTITPAPTRAAVKPAQSPMRPQFPRPAAATTATPPVPVSPANAISATPFARPATTAIPTPVRAATGQASVPPQSPSGPTPVESTTSAQSLTVPTPAAAASATVPMPVGFGPGAAKEQRKAEKELRKQQRAEQKAERFASPGAPTPLQASPGESAPQPPGKGRGKGKRAAERAASATATPTPTPTR